MLLFCLFFLFVQIMSEPVNKKNNNGFGYLRKQVLDLQNKNERLENNIAKLTDSIDRLIFVIEKMNNDNNSEIDNENHYKYICDRIVDKIQNSLVFPKRQRKDMILDKAAGIKYDIKKEPYDRSIIGTNMIFPNMNPSAAHTYKVIFYVYGKFAEEEKFVLLPTYEESNTNEEYEYEDIFVYNRSTSVYFPRVFYETIDANGVIDVAEFP